MVVAAATHFFTSASRTAVKYQKPPEKTRYCMRSLFPYAGGKHRVAKKLIELFHEHRCYVEVFAGAAEWSAVSRMATQR